MLDMPKTFVRLDAADNVVTAIRGLKPGDSVEGVSVADDVPAGHKVTTRTVAEGEPLIKYAQIIGYASEPIEFMSTM